MGRVTLASSNSCGLVQRCSIAVNADLSSTATDQSRAPRSCPSDDRRALSRSVGTHSRRLRRKEVLSILSLRLLAALVMIHFQVNAIGSKV